MQAGAPALRRGVGDATILATQWQRYFLYLLFSFTTGPFQQIVHSQTIIATMQLARVSSPSLATSARRASVKAVAPRVSRAYAVKTLALLGPDGKPSKRRGCLPCLRLAANKTLQS